MNNIVMAVILFFIGLVCLIKGGDWFVDGATGIAHRLKMPELLIGATVVSIGTTLPEVMVSATAAVSNHSQIAYGNAVGSVICNTALILAITAAFSPQKVERKGLVIPVLFFFVAAGFYAGIAYIEGTFTRLTGIILLMIFVVYMVVLEKQAKAAMIEGKNSENAKNEDDKAETECENAAENIDATEKVLNKKSEEKESTIVKEIAFLAAGAVFIAVGADLLVDNGTILAEAMGVPESVIALTFVALGTSLPELVTAVTSLIKGHGALSLGNVIGANLFNLVLVSGLATTLAPFEVPAEKTLMGINASLIVDVPLMFIVMLIATVPTLIKGKISRWQGILLISIYVLFCAYQFAV